MATAFTLLSGCQRERTAPPPSSHDRPAAPASPAAPAAPAVEPAPAQPPRAPSEARSGAPPLPEPLPGERTDLTAVAGSAQRAVIADVDGDGSREIVLVDASEIRVVRPDGQLVARAPIRDGIQALLAADVDGDGRAEIFAGWGRTREHMGSKARLSRHRLEGGQLVEETVLAPETSRNDVADLVWMPERDAVLFAYFDSKYNVTTTLVRPVGSSWESEKLASLRMATSYAWGDVDGDGRPDLVVGRVYGDTQGSDGDAFTLAPDGTRRRIPTTRGVRSLAIADADGDGRAEVFLGDGWHQHYGTNARGLLSWARHSAGSFRTEQIEDTQGQYGIDNIVPVKLADRVAIVAAGNHYVRVFSRRDGRWEGVTIGGPVRDIAVGDLDGAPGDEILLLGDRTELVTLRAADWRR